jgi:RimJ/RimL family protein N-acetyltransferase
VKKIHLKETITYKDIFLEKADVHLAEIMFEKVDNERERLALFLPWVNFVKTIEDEQKFIQQSIKDWENYTKALFAIFRKSDAQYLGNISVFNLDFENESCEIGYWISSKYEGKGYMIQSVSALEKELFEKGFNRIVILCQKTNNRSKKIPKALNYRHEGTLFQFYKINNNFVNFDLYAKLKSML